MQNTIYQPVALDNGEIKYLKAVAKGVKNRMFYE